MEFGIRVFFDATVSTVTVTAASALLGIAISLLAGAARISPLRSVRLVTAAYVEVFRGTSVLVQLYWLYFVLPTLGLTLPPLVAGVMALGLNFGSYGAEIVRSGLEAVPRGQWDAASALNLSSWQRFRLVIMPQALPIIIPSMINNLVDLLKASSLLSLITATDLTHAARQLTGIGYFNVTVGYGLVLIGYFLLALPIVALGRRSERWASRHVATSETR